jgi:NTP pyrophosphatase (non-canonical NTP hydrolase)
MDFFVEARTELERAFIKHGDINSLHEGYAVLLEEVDELWDEIKKRTESRDLNNLKLECIQIAAMAGKIHHYISNME